MSEQDLALIRMKMQDSGLEMVQRNGKIYFRRARDRREDPSPRQLETWRNMARSSKEAKGLKGFVDGLPAVAAYNRVSLSGKKVGQSEKMRRVLRALEAAEAAGLTEEETKLLLDLV